MATKNKANTPAQGKEQDRVYDLDNLPEDFTVDSSQQTFEPLKPGAYQVEVSEVVLKDNIFYKPLNDQGKPSNPATKYTIAVTMIVLDEGDDYGRRVWDNFSPIVKPTGKKGASKAYKFITSVLQTELNWDECAGFAPTPVKFFENMKSLEKKQVSVMLEVSTSETGVKRSKVVSYFPTKKALPPYEVPTEE